MKKEIAKSKEEMGSVLCVYTWLVTKWSEKLKKAVKDDIIEYESRAFYISEPGHHMKLRIQPNDKASVGYVGVYLTKVSTDYFKSTRNEK
eukprot:m.242184 g.242184  ORF g.242184 m.242184 type:complete len:90 (+) comp40214_c0_seq13:710-979(+)